MKTHVQLYDVNTNDGKFQIPDILVRLRQWIVQHASEKMRIFGIGRLTTKHSAVGVASLFDPSFAPLPEQPPETLLRCRNRIVRALSDELLLYGILEIEILPTPEEMEVIKGHWHVLETGQTPEGTPASNDDIKLNLETDPTAESVIEEKPEPEAASEEKPEPEAASEDKPEPEDGGQANA